MQGKIKETFKLQDGGTITVENVSPVVLMAAKDLARHGSKAYTARVEGEMRSIYSKLSMLAQNYDFLCRNRLNYKISASELCDFSELMDVINENVRALNSKYSKMSKLGKKEVRSRTGLKRGEKRRITNPQNTKQLLQAKQKEAQNKEAQKQASKKKEAASNAKSEAGENDSPLDVVTKL